MHIIAAILPKNQTELNTKVNKILGLVSYVQVDVCDGKFVPSKTQFSELTHLDTMEYELDLMMNKPENNFEPYIEMQPARMVIHLESVKDFEKLFEKLKPLRGIIEIGFCISNDSPKELLDEHINECDFIQLMGIARIGFQGQDFDERVLEKIKYFHDQYPDKIISIDGDVNQETIGQLKNAGATRFIVGSAIFDQGGLVDNIEKLESLIQ